MDWEQIQATNNLQLKCPALKEQFNKATYLCEKIANYQVDGTVYCRIHAAEYVFVRANQIGSTKVGVK